VLDAERISKRFGQVQALRDVSLSVAPGEVRALCGENGAGKSTLVKTLMGLYRPDSGVVRIHGQAEEVRGPHHAQSLGLALVAQELSIAPHLSVLDNIWLGSDEVPFFHRKKAFRDRARQALRRLGAGHLDLDRKAGTLGIGEQQILEIARLLTREARILILDEPTATLSDVEIRNLFGVLRTLKQEGRAIIYITHRLGEVFEICDSVTVLRNGENVDTKPVPEVTRDALIELMLGRSFGDMYAKPPRSEGLGDGIVVENLSVPATVRSTSFRARRGRVLCLAGQLGSGANVVIRALAGLIPEATGRVAIDGVPIRLGSAAQSRRRGVVYVSDDRAGEGLFPSLTVLENLVATRISEHTRLGVLSWQAIRRSAGRMAGLVSLDSRRLGSPAIDLSGGNQQKILFGRILGEERPGVVLMSEPTRGVDVGARAEIYGIMHRLCAAGHTLIMYSSDLEEVVGVANDVVTYYRGEIVGRYEDDSISSARLLSDITHPAIPMAGAA
jgi:ABC-type sugar transport system ATPase subunit